MRRLRLTHPALDFWDDVRLREFEGKWLAVADLGGTPEVGTAAEPAEALRGASAPFGSTLAEELVAGISMTQASHLEHGATPRSAGSRPRYTMSSIAGAPAVTKRRRP